MSHLATLVTTAKNEGPYIWEWVAYHKMIGFEKIIMFQNDSDDGTDAILKALRDAGIVKYLYNRADRGRHQVKAYNRSRKQEEYQAADYVMALDMDEFLVIETGDGTVRSLIEALPSFDCALINWKMFGSSGATQISDELVTERFVLAEADKTIRTFPKAFKSLFRQDVFERPGIHRPLGLDTDTGEFGVTNGSGLPITEFAVKNFRSIDPEARKLAQINHYIVKDAMNFVLKNHKGSAHQANRSIDRGYWRKRNKNTEADFKIRQHLPALRAEMKRIDEATQGAMSHLTRLALDHHRATFKTLMQDAQAAELYQYCQSEIAIDRSVRHLSLVDE